MTTQTFERPSADSAAHHTATELPPIAMTQEDRDRLTSAPRREVPELQTPGLPCSGGQFVSRLLGPGR